VDHQVAAAGLLVLLLVHGADDEVHEKTAEKAGSREVKNNREAMLQTVRRRGLLRDYRWHC
jgi:hypothetical protein